MRFHGDFNTGAYASWGPTVATRVPVHASGPYKTPAYLATSRAVHTNGPTAGAFRGFGVPQAAIVQEMLYDDLAEACGQDRLTFRRLNAIQDGDKTPCGQTLNSVGLIDCLDALAPHWEQALQRAIEHNETNGPTRRGVGVASCWYGCGNTSLPNPSTVRIGITHDGRLVLHQGATDIGQGSNTVIAQIAADAMGVSLKTIELVGPDTALTPDCGKTSASRQTFITGRAAAAAGSALRAAILRQTNLTDKAVIALFDGRLQVSDSGTTREIDLCALTPRRQRIRADLPKKPMTRRPRRLTKTVRGHPTRFTVSALRWPKLKSTWPLARHAFCTWSPPTTWAVPSTRCWQRDRSKAALPRG